jgi:flagellin
MSSRGLGIGASGDPNPTTDLQPPGENITHIRGREAAAAAIDVLSSAINSVSMFRANIGAMQNRLEFKIQNLDNQAENISAAESRIRDVDMARAMTEFTRNNILFQASTAMLAQANALPQSVLQLIG